MVGKSPIVAIPTYLTGLRTAAKEPVGGEREPCEAMECSWESQETKRPMLAKRRKLPRFIDLRTEKT